MARRNVCGDDRHECLADVKEQRCHSDMTEAMVCIRAHLR